MKNEKLLPLELDMPRVWRTYTGGAMIDKLHGIDGGADEHFPEEWIMSVVSARNIGREHIENEGLSLVKSSGKSLKSCIEQDPAAYLGKEHMERCGAHPGVLVKLLDSAERLAIQVHPNRQKAMELFGTPFGKTECWYILGGREIDGRKPGVYLGFKEGITRELWKDLFERQDIEGMLSCLHRFDVEPGDIMLIHGGVPHAIDAGCFLAEIQEPTDLTIRTERTTPGGYQMPDAACHQGIGFEKMFDCFDYTGLSREEARRRWFLTPHELSASPEAAVTKLVDYDDTSYFAMNQIKVSGHLQLKRDSFSAWYVLRGKGKLLAQKETLPLAAPMQLFIPASSGETEIIADEELEILEFFGPCTKP